MTSRAGVPASWSALAVPTIVAFAPKHVGAAADALGRWIDEPISANATTKRVANLTSRAVSAEPGFELERRAQRGVGDSSAGSTRTGRRRVEGILRRIAATRASRSPDSTIGGRLPRILTPVLMSKS